MAFDVPRRSRRGEAVFSRSYDSDGMAGSTEGRIYERGGRYHAESCDDLASGGPFRSLEEAIRESGLGQGTRGPEFASSRLTTEQLLGLVELLGEGPISVNGEWYDWDREAGEWRLWDE